MIVKTLRDRNYFTWSPGLSQSEEVLVYFAGGYAEKFSCILRERWKNLWGRFCPSECLKQTLSASIVSSTFLSSSSHRSIIFLSILLHDLLIPHAGCFLLDNRWNNISLFTYYLVYRPRKTIMTYLRFTSHHSLLKLISIATQLMLQK